MNGPSRITRLLGAMTTAPPTEPKALEEHLARARSIAWCSICHGEMRRGASVVCTKCLLETVRARRESYLAEARASIPTVFRGLRLDGDELPRRVTSASPELLAAALEYTASARVVLLGPSGAGKTSIGCAMLNALIDRGAALDCTPTAFRTAQGARFVDALELRTAVAEWKLGQGTPPEVEEAHAATVLLLDDVGKELELKTANPIPEIVRYRHARGLPTWVTTSLDETKMTISYDQAHMRRIFEGAPPPISLGEV